MIITNAKWYASTMYASSIPELSPMGEKAIARAETYHEAP
jgi:hypothetical protein